MKLARERAIVLERAAEAARRWALYEARYFRCAVRHGRTGRERTRLRRDRYRTLARHLWAELERDVEELARLGLHRAGVGLVDAGADRVAAGRIAYLESHGLPAEVGLQVDLAIDGMPTAARN